MTTPSSDSHEQPLEYPLEEPGEALENAVEPGEPLAADEVDDLLLEEEIPVVDEPDDAALTLEAEDLESLVKDEPLELLDNPNLMVELSEDPVRLYLKEIGGIELLDTHKEFWLSARLEAVRRIEHLSRGHPLARRGPAEPQSIYRAMFDELKTAWSRVK